MALTWKMFVMSRVLIALSVVLAVIRIVLDVIRHPSVLFKRPKRRDTPPDCMLDPTLGKHQYVQANGIKFHYVTCGDPSKPLMLLLHGFPEFWYSWRYQLKVFSDNHHVVAVDLRGYNKTDCPPNVLDYTLPNLCQDVVKLIPALGHDKAILVAHDWGGAIAWSVADQHPEVVDKLIIMNCPHPHVMRKRIKHFSQLMKSWYVFFFQVPWLPEFGLSIGNCEFFNEVFRGTNGVCNKQAFSVEDVEAYKYVFSQAGALTGPLNYYRANAFRGLDGKGDVIAVPTLLIWGEKDAFFDVALADGHGGVVSDLTVQHIENCGHWVQNDNPERVNQHMREFIENND